MAERLYLGTRKGLMIYGRNGKGWAHKNTAFLASPVSIMLASHDNLTILTALHLSLYSAKLHSYIDSGVSCGGVTLTEDGGKTWRIAGHGLRSDYTPPDQAQDPVTQDVHMMVQCPAAPGTYWIQHHNGIFRSTDDLKSWHELTAPVSVF